MGSLAHQDKRSLRELNDCIEEGSSDVVVFDGEHSYPSIAIDPAKIIKPSIRNELACDAFIEKPIPLWKKAWYSAKSKGFLSGVQVIADHCFEEETLLTRSVQKVAWFVLLLWEALISIYGSFYPYDLLTNDQLCKEFSHNLDWENSIIRSFAWHPNFNNCAIALSNDDVYIYTTNQSVNPLLRHPIQRKIISLSWMPKNQDVLAVGCQSLVVIWTIDTTTGATSAMARISLTCARIVDVGLPLPVTSMTFDPSGEWLVISGPTTSKIVLVNSVNREKENKIVRKLGAGITRLNWSPDGCRLLCHTTSKYIRIFENKAWSSSTWGSGVFDDICQASCWSPPSGRFLLVVAKNDSSIHAVTFLDKADTNVVGGTTSLIKVFDLKDLEHPEGRSVGGAVHEMVWDKHAERLVISFKENSEFVAVFKTRIKPTLEITFLGFLHGLEGERPNSMDFHDKFSQGSLLSICWSSGVVSHIPFQYHPNVKASILGISSSTPRSLTNFCSSPSMLPSPIGSPMDRTRISSPKNFSFLASDRVVTPRKPTLFSQLPD